TNAPAPLRPAARAGLLTFGSVLALLDGELTAARSLAVQARELGLLGAYLPVCRPGAPLAAVAVAGGAPAGQAVGHAWEEILARAADGHVLAAVVDGAWLAGVHPDLAPAASLGAHVPAGQGPLLTGLGAYLEALAHGSADGLLAAGADLRACGAAHPAARAHEAAIRLLRSAGEHGRAAEELDRLRSELADAEEQWRLLQDLEPAAQLTEREAEVARLIA